MGARAAGWAGAFFGTVAILAASPGWSGPIRSGEEYGLGLLGPEVPPILKQARADPYAPPAEPACTTVPQELATLDDLLGPDMGAAPKRNLASDFVGGAIRHAVPYRGWVRFLTGADRKDKALSRAVMAGWARRGYLKGIARSLDCGDRRVASAEPAAPAPPPPAIEVGALRPAAEVGVLQPASAVVAEPTAPLPEAAIAIEAAAPR
jgi:hypothetical protein